MQRRLRARHGCLTPALAPTGGAVAGRPRVSRRRQGRSGGLQCLRSCAWDRLAADARGSSPGPGEPCDMQDSPARPNWPWPRTSALLVTPGGHAVTLSRGDVLLAAGVIEAVAATIVPAGQAAWLAAAEWRSPGARPRLRRLRRVTEGEGVWAEAAAALIAAWAARTQRAPREPCRSAQVRRQPARDPRPLEQPPA
jgi:hypothetical protein